MRTEEFGVVPPDEEVTGEQDPVDPAAQPAPSTSTAPVSRYSWCCRIYEQMSGFGKGMVQRRLSTRKRWHIVI